MRYRKRPVVIDAVQWTGDNYDEITEFVVEDGGGVLRVGGGGQLSVWNEPERQWITAPRGHWVIRGVAGEHYPCDPAIFDATYEPAEEPDLGTVYRVAAAELERQGIPVIREYDGGSS